MSIFCRLDGRLSIVPGGSQFMSGTGLWIALAGNCSPTNLLALAVAAGTPWSSGTCSKGIFQSGGLRIRHSVWEIRIKEMFSGAENVWVNATGEVVEKEVGD